MSILKSILQDCAYARLIKAAEVAGEGEGEGEREGEGEGEGEGDGEGQEIEIFRVALCRVEWRQRVLRCHCIGTGAECVSLQ